jgi:uncharacterized membrane protein YbaN (DUF454 family)
MLTLGTIALCLGMITFWLPIPIGLPLLLTGVLLLVRYSPLAKRQLIRQMRRRPQLRRLLQKRKNLCRFVAASLSK